MTFDHNHLSNILGSEPIDLRSENAELRAEVKRLREENVDLWNAWGKITERLDLPEDVSIGKALEVMCDRYAVELAESEIARRDQEIERLMTLAQDMCRVEGQEGREVKHDHQTN